MEQIRLKEHRELILTDGLAGFGRGVNLVALLALAFVTADLVDADLAAGVQVGALVNIWIQRGLKKTTM